ncbi:MAG: hypothetical protein VX015_11865 [Planctomycetota bacterium]|jgi:hypothetical protein|nr:hypothetical protein [Planctomycetota bacterium]
MLITRVETRDSASRRSGFLQNPVLLERGLGVLLWVGLLAVLFGRPF